MRNMKPLTDRTLDADTKAFIAVQRKLANGQRLEMLERDLHGTIKLLRTLIMPIFGSFEGFQLEYEFVGPSGYKFYADVYYEPLRLMIECDGYVPHVELMTRERFSMDRQRLRSMAVAGYLYMPFSWDELDKKPDACRASLFELLGRRGRAREGLESLDPRERELLRNAADGKVFKQNDACRWLQVGKDTARTVLRRMIADGWIVPEGGGERRHHVFRLGEKGLRVITGRVD